MVPRDDKSSKDVNEVIFFSAIWYLRGSAQKGEAYNAVITLTKFKKLPMLELMIQLK